jgi:hypothetical protein
MARSAEQSYDPQEGLTFESTEKIKVVSSFEGLHLKDALLRGVYQFGFEKPSAIQQRAILPIVQGRDVIAQAQSGTGKTSMIAISLVQLLDPSLNECVPFAFRFFHLLYRCLQDRLVHDRLMAAGQQVMNRSHCACVQGAEPHPVADARAGSADHEDHPGGGRIPQSQGAYLRRRHQPRWALAVSSSCPTALEQLSLHRRVYGPVPGVCGKRGC